MKLTNIIKPLLVATAVFGLFASKADGAERRFVYSYETKTYVPGSVELENWVTWKTDDGFDRFDFRHEIEIGITERFQLGLYLVDWRLQDGEESYHDSAIEGIYNILNPYEDPFGLSLYGEVKFADEFLELESKVLLQKNFGPLTLVYNFILESEWEEEGLSEVKGEIGNTLGLSYMLNQKVGVGAEMLHELEIEDWNDAGKSAIYLGPNATFRAGPAWVTAAGLWEVTDTEEPEFQLRLLTGWHF